MQSRMLSVDRLELDPLNPRLPETLIGDNATSILKWLDTTAVLNELAASMVTNGFFPHEPLIVLEANSKGQHVVVEGNRRFASLSILLQLPVAVAAGLEFDFAVTPDGDQLRRLHEVPCFVVETREEVRKYLGFRHIGGIKTWSPEAKARYLDEEVKLALRAGSQNVFRDVGRLVGSNAAGVRGPYVALHILRAARDNFGVETNHVMQHRFGVWNRMMNSRDLREYIGFGEASTVEEVTNSVQQMDPRKLNEVIGDLTPAEGQRTSVLSDSRDVTVYAAILLNERARETLRAHRDLNLARQVVERANFGQKIRNLTRSVELLLRDIDNAEVSQDVADAARTLFAQARTLSAGIDARLKSDDDD